ncbi:MAG: hypothetical protein ACOYKE_00225 [Ferruginibacter sp.]
MIQNANEIKPLVQQQLFQIDDDLIKTTIEQILIEPNKHFRIWENSTTAEEIECWTIAIDKENNSSIVYAELGFGPNHPWGLVSNSSQFVGIDSGWLKNLKDCFLDSFKAAELPIWIIEKRVNAEQHEQIAENITMQQAFEIINKLTTDNKIYHVLVRK